MFWLCFWPHNDAVRLWRRLADIEGGKAEDALMRVLSSPDCGENMRGRSFFEADTAIRFGEQRGKLEGHAAGGRGNAALAWLALSRVLGGRATSIIAGVQ